MNYLKFLIFVISFAEDCCSMGSALIFPYSSFMRNAPMSKATSLSSSSFLPTPFPLYSLPNASFKETKTSSSDVDSLSSSADLLPSPSMSLVSSINYRISVLVNLKHSYSLETFSQALLHSSQLLMPFLEMLLRFNLTTLRRTHTYTIVCCFGC